MKLRPVSEWREEPFSFHKLWLGLSVWFGIGSFPLLVWEPFGWFYGGLVAWALLNLLFQRPLKRLCWRLCSQRFRDGLPFDRTEALAGKGIIHSYSDLWHWLRAR